MRCSRCGVDSNRTERMMRGGRCKRCNHPFALEPTSMGTVKCTDLFFAKTISALSVNNTLYFTRKQFFYFLDRRIKRESAYWINFSIKSCIAGLFLMIFLLVPVLLLFGFILGSVQLDDENKIGIFYVIPFVIGGLLLFSNLQKFQDCQSSRSSRNTRLTKARRLQIQGFLIGVIGGFYSFVVNSILLYGWMAFVSLASVWLGFFALKRSAKIPEIFAIETSKMQDFLDRWTSINGSPSYLLPSLSKLPPATEEMPDRSITAYSFDRLVVCQSDEVAQMLIANNFHFENNCAILAISGYPNRIFDTTMQMLRRNPELRVFAFHDCSPEGIKLAYQLRTDSRWFPEETIPIIDVGLSVRQILASKRDVFIRASKASAGASQALDPRVRQNLSKEELQWLDGGNFVELESFTPRTLIRVLQRSIANSRALESIEENNLILLGDSGSMYSIDSFG